MEENQQNKILNQENHHEQTFEENTKTDRAGGLSRACLNNNNYIVCHCSHFGVAQCSARTVFLRIFQYASKKRCIIGMFRAKDELLE